MNKHKIYLASSWRNPLQPHMVDVLRSDGHEVYDFRNPDPADPSNHGFGWRQIRDRPESWSPSDLREVLKHPIAKKAHALDHGAMAAATACILLLPAGSSAHLEAGWCAGQGIPTVAFAPMDMRDPELMYLSLAPAGVECIITDPKELKGWLRDHAPASYELEGPANKEQRDAAHRAKAFELIAAERQRQLAERSTEDEDRDTRGDLARAGGDYAYHSARAKGDYTGGRLAFDGTRRECLARGAALMVAELERLMRAGEGGK